MCPPSPPKIENKAPAPAPAPASQRPPVYGTNEQPQGKRRGRGSLRVRRKSAKAATGSSNAGTNVPR